MGGDHTRFTFKAEKNYSGVLKQQGRVSLDADWNEAVEIDDRRWRSETIDIIGYCVVPAVTPDAFRVTPTGPGTFSIGIGRCYVDGLQAECHGLDLQRYDRHLGELKGTTEVPYADQPFYPAPLPPELSPAVGRTDLIYLDVWQREVTAIEDPAIQEIALGGPDTATRVQTVWQVRALEGVGDIDCADAIDEWDTLVEPSAGRLTSTAVAPAPSDDPCIISPAGGYRGLENRLYRVEIHTPGPLGTAEFKWSRDNGSIVAKVEAITDAGTTSQVTVHQLGRDQVLRFNVGDWVEILDDHREFQGLPGHIGKIANIDEANRILEVEPAIPASMDFDPADPERHTRVRRWDQKGTVVDADNNVIVDLDAPGSTGLIPVPAAGVLVVLEDGVQVQFDIDPANSAGEFKIGDYWVFAARTADGSVEELEAAPPRGIEHHYCRLALVTWAEDVESTRVRDCRRLWPPAHCCVSARPGEDIQAAIDGLPPEGGCVCLMPGLHEVHRPLMIEDRKNVTLTGVGGASKLVFAPMAADGVDENLAVLYVVGASHGIAVNNFLIHADALCQLIVIDEASQEVTIEDMRLVNGYNADTEEAVERTTCMLLGDCAEVTVLESKLVGPFGLVQGSRDLIGRVREACASVRPTPEEGPPAEPASAEEAEASAEEPPFEHAPLRDLRVESSQFYCAGGIRLADVLGGRIKGNRLYNAKEEIILGFGRTFSPESNNVDVATAGFYEMLDENLSALPSVETEPSHSSWPAIYSSMLEGVEIQDNEIVFTRGIVIQLSRRVVISSNLVESLREGVSLGYSFDTRVDQNEIRMLGEEEKKSGDDDPLVGYFAARERTGGLAIGAGLAKGLRVCKNTIQAPSGIGNARSALSELFYIILMANIAYMPSVLRVLGIERLWRISVELAWFLYQLILFVLAITGNAVTEPMTKEALGRYMYGWLAAFLTGPYVPYFIGKTVVADNRMTVRHFGVYFYKILTVGGLRIHRNRVSGFDNTGILVHPWYSVGLADAHARFLRCAILNFIIFLTLLRDALAEYLEGEEPAEQPATEAGIVGYLALGVSWIVMLCARYCGGAAEEPGGDGGEQPPSPAEVLKDALDDFLDHVDPAWIDDLVNQSYEIDKNVVAGVGDGIYTGIDGSRISKNQVTLWPATTVPYETVVFGVLLPRHFDAAGMDVDYSTDALWLLAWSAVELDRDFLFLSGMAAYEWPEEFLDNDGNFQNVFRTFLAEWEGYVDPVSPLSGPIDEMQAGLDPNNLDPGRVLAGWQAAIEVLVRAQRGYGILMRGANMVCKGNKVASETGCGGAAEQQRRADAVVGVGTPVSVSALRQKTPSDIPAIGGIWQYTNFVGWLIDLYEFGFQDREFSGLDLRDSDSVGYIYRLVMWLVAFLFLLQERERGLHIAQNEVTRSLVHGIRSVAVMQAKDLEVYDNTVRDASRHGFLHYGWLEDEMNIKVHRNTLTKASGSSVFSRLGGLDDGFASLAQVFNDDGTTLMSHNSGDDKTSKGQQSAIYVDSGVVSITSNHVITNATLAFEVPSNGELGTRGLFTDNVTNKPNDVPATILHEPNIILTP